MRALFDAVGHFRRARGVRLSVEHDAPDDAPLAVRELRAHQDKTVAEVSDRIAPDST